MNPSPEARLLLESHLLLELRLNPPGGGPIDPPPRRSIGGLSDRLLYVTWSVKVLGEHTRYAFYVKGYVNIEYVNGGVARVHHPAQ